MGLGRFNVTGSARVFRALMLSISSSTERRSVDENNRDCHRFVVGCLSFDGCRGAEARPSPKGTLPCCTGSEETNS